MQKLDRRVKYTKAVLRQALVELLREKDIERITVKELCESADINRGTFYCHYKSPRDLLEQIESELKDEMLTSVSAHYSPEIAAESMILCIINTIKVNSDLCSVILSNHGDPEFLEKVMNTTYDVFSSSWSNRLPDDDRAIIGYLYSFFALGSCGIIRRWIQTGMPETPEYLAHLVSVLNRVGLLGWLNEEDDCMKLKEAARKS